MHAYAWLCKLYEIVIFNRGGGSLQGCRVGPGEVVALGGRVTVIDFFCMLLQASACLCMVMHGYASYMR